MTTILPSILAAEGRASDFVDLDVQAWQWAALLAFIAVLLVADLLVVHRDAHEIQFKEAAVESAIWISIGVAFTGVIFLIGGDLGGRAAGEYISGFLLEKSLSIDNVFIWAVIFSFFAVPPKYQFRTLFWGIFGALVLRAVFILAGSALITRFTVTLAVFGVVLLYTAWKLAFHDEHEVNPDKSLVLRAVRKVVPSTPNYDGQKLFTRDNGKRLATPLFAVLIMIETTDVVFAVDSVPAIFGVANEPFILFSSNAFAILGLRSLFFCVSGMQDRFEFLNVGLGAILAFVGVKMLLTFSVEAFEWPSEDFHIPTAISLGVIVVVLTITIVASNVRGKRQASGPDGGPGTSGPTSSSDPDADSPGPSGTAARPSPEDTHTPVD